MTLTFTAEEILDIAERMERNGAAFYRAAADLVDDPALRLKLNELAGMEDAHERAFAAIRGALPPSDNDPAAKGGEDVGPYLRAMADASSFDRSMDPMDLAQSNASLEALLKVAIELEKESILFYLGLRELVADAATRERLDEILREEREHVAILAAMLRSVA